MILRASNPAPFGGRDVRVFSLQINLRDKYVYIRNMER